MGPVVVALAACFVLSALAHVAIARTFYYPLMNLLRVGAARAVPTTGVVRALDPLFVPRGDLDERVWD